MYRLILKTWRAKEPNITTRVHIILSTKASYTREHAVTKTHNTNTLIIVSQCSRQSGPILPKGIITQKTPLLHKVANYSLPIGFEETKIRIVRDFGFSSANILPDNTSKRCR